MRIAVLLFCCLASFAAVAAPLATMPAKMRDLAERITRFGPLRTMIYFVEYLLLISILGFPLAVYEGFFRERQYGLATQTFGPWMGDQLKDFMVNLIIGAIITAALF